VLGLTWCWERRDAGKGVVLGAARAGKGAVLGLVRSGSGAGRGRRCRRIERDGLTRCWLPGRAVGASGSGGARRRCGPAVAVRLVGPGGGNALVAAWEVRLACARAQEPSYLPAGPRLSGVFF